MKSKSTISQPPLREEPHWILKEKEEATGRIEEKEMKMGDIPLKKIEQELSSSDVYSMLYLSPDVEDAIIKEMIAYACVVADGAEGGLFPVRFSNVSGRKVLIIHRHFKNPTEVEELLSMSYAAYLASDA